MSNKRFDVAQVCLNGHLVTSLATSSPEEQKKKCGICGQTTIMACPKCHTPIRGGTLYDNGFRAGRKRISDHCGECGEVYPWVKQQTLEERQESGTMSGSSNVERLRHFRGTLPYPTYDRWHEVNTWAAAVSPFIRRQLPDDASNFDELTREPNWKVSLSTKDIDVFRVKGENNQLAKGKVDAISAFIRGLIELEQGQVAKAKTGAQMTTKNNKVFIVHGHDEAMRENVARTLGDLGLDPIILNEQINQGKTIIEKLEAHSDVAYAVVLLSPDDEGYAVKDGPTTAKKRPRQNVVAELFYFIGALGRKNVLSLVKDHVEILSDFQGIVWESFDSNNGWKIRLVQELNAAGFNVDANKLYKK